MRSPGGGRFIAGLGVSGPQIVEGWYGQPWGRPYYRLKDYVEIMRKVFRREEPVVHDGQEISLPYTGEGAAGVGKPLKSILHMNPDIPIYIGAGNAATVRLTAEICDGWLPLGLTPAAAAEYLPWVEEGFARAKAKGVDKGFHNFEIVGSAHVEIDEDVSGALARLKPEVALYVGGMGHRNKNFHKEMMVRRGYGDAATASRSCSSPAARTRRPPRSRTNGSTRSPWSARPRASRSATSAGRAARCWTACTSARSRTRPSR